MNIYHDVRILLISLAAVCVVAACDDDDSGADTGGSDVNVDDSGSPDAGNGDTDLDADTGNDSDASADTTDSGGEVDDPDAQTDTSPSLNSCIVVAALDGDTGSLAVVDVASLTGATDVASIYSDAVVTTNNEEVYVVNRLGADSLQRINPATDYTTEWERSLGNSTNPQTAVFIGNDTAFVPQYNGQLVRVDLTSQEADPITATVTLPVPSFSGSTAEAVLAFTNGDTVFVVAQGLDDSFACLEGAHSTVYAYDQNLEPFAFFGTETELALSTCNAGASAVIDDVAYIGSLGSFRFAGDVDDGAIEALDLATGHTTVVATEADFGGEDIFALAPTEDGDGLWVTSADSSFTLRVRRLTFGESATIDPPIWTGDVWGVVNIDDKLFIGDRTAGAFGIVVLNDATGDRLDDGVAVDTGLPPRNITLLQTESACLPD